MASPAFGAIGSLTGVNGTTSVSRPSVSSGDLMILGAVAAFGDATITPPSGWTALASIDQGSAFELEVRLYWKIASGSEPSSYSVQIGGQGGGNNFGYGWIWTYTGHDSTTPIQVTGTQRNTSSSTSALCAGVTTTSTDTTLVCVYVSGNNSVSNTWTPPSGMTERLDAGANPTGFVVGVADVAVASSGATGTKTATSSLSGTSNCITFAIAPAGGGGTNGTGTGSIDSVDLIAPTGSASTSGNATASGALDSVDLIAATGFGSGTGSVTGTGSVHSVDLTAPTGSASSIPTFVTPPLKNNAGTVLASISGWTVNVYNQTNGALIVQKTSLSTDSTGRLTIVDASMSGSTTYAYEPVHATYGRRLPTISAV